VPARYRMRLEEKAGNEAEPEAVAGDRRNLRGVALELAVPALVAALGTIWTGIADTVALPEAVELVLLVRLGELTEAEDEP